MDSCIFCKIIKGEIPSYKVYEDNLYLAFLTIQPIKEGHTLVIPKKHTDYFFDLDTIDMANLMNASKKVAEMLKEVFKPESGKVGVMVAGEEVPHVHIHLIPFDDVKDFDLSKARSSSQENLKTTLDKITA